MTKSVADAIRGRPNPSRFFRPEDHWDYIGNTVAYRAYFTVIGFFSQELEQQFWIELVRLLRRAIRLL